MTDVDTCKANREGEHCITIHRYQILGFDCVDHIAGLAEPRNDNCMWLGAASKIPGSEQEGISSSGDGGRSDNNNENGR